ncbi:MAG TPA: hypothetical protein VK196_09080 [Magnetospirillum sp.]|nr:hypothetical protein [Magnetospirillum sp.]
MFQHVGDDDGIHLLDAAPLVDLLNAGLGVAHHVDVVAILHVHADDPALGKHLAPTPVVIEHRGTAAHMQHHAFLQTRAQDGAPIQIERFDADAVAFGQNPFVQRGGGGKDGDGGGHARCRLNSRTGDA